MLRAAARKIGARHATFVRGLRTCAVAPRTWPGRGGADQWLLALAVVCVAAAAPARSAPPPPVSLEYQVKATYLYKLAPFVNWPPEVFASPREPFRICVVGRDPFDDFLRKAVAGHRFGTHPFEVRSLAALTPGVPCQIVFLSRLQTQSVHDALAAVNGQPVLTVMDSGMADDGEVMQFVIDRGRVGFEVDTAAAARHHITISSKLLSLALAVREGP